MGVFALTVNSAALRHHLLPRVLGYVGVVGGMLFIPVFLGSLSHTAWLIDFTVALGGSLSVRYGTSGPGLCSGTGDRGKNRVQGIGCEEKGIGHSVGARSSRP